MASTNEITQNLGHVSAFAIARAHGFTGTEKEWLSSLAGPTGPKGEQGESAYEIAVEHGFVGSAEEWLASLVGPRGETGPQGEAGQDGGMSYTLEDGLELLAELEIAEPITDEQGNIFVDEDENIYTLT